MNARFRRAVTATAVLLSTACSSDSDSPGPSTPDVIVGTWSLTTFNGVALPAPFDLGGGVTFMISSGSALVAEVGSFTATYNGTVNGVAASLGINGTWTRSGSTYTIVGTQTLNGVPAGSTTATATASGNSLTVTSPHMEQWTRGTIVTPPPGPDVIVGTWSLTTFNGVALPAPFDLGGGVTFMISSGSALVAEVGSFTATYNGTVNGVAASLGINGTWTRSGSTYTIVGTQTLNGAPAGSTTATATASGNSLTVTSPHMEQWTRGTIVTPPPGPDVIVGTWSLTTFNGVALPAPFDLGGGVTFMISSGSALVAEVGSFTATYNGTVNGVAASLGINGTWTRSGSTYTIVGTQTLNGVPAGSTTATATASGNSLTVTSPHMEQWTRGTIVTPPPGPDVIVGTWSLTTFNGVALPAPFDLGGGVTFMISSGSALVAEVGSFTATYNGTVNGVAASLGINGTWTRSGSTYTIVGTQTLNGAPAGSTTATATASGNSLTVTSPHMEQWTRQTTPPPPMTLLSVSGETGRQGAGTITSTPVGISCQVSAGNATGTCSHEWPQGTIVQLSAASESGSRFVSWSAPCSATSACNITLSSATVVQAAFDLAFALSLDPDQQQFAEVADSPSLDLSSEWTIETWIWQEAINNNLFIISKWGTAPEASYVLEANVGYLRLATNDGVNTSTVLEENTVAMPVHTWIHIAATYSAGVARLYINGAEVAQGAMSQPANSSKPLSFGREGPPLNSRYFPGRLDEIRMWNVARTQSQIMSTMNTVISAPTAGLVGYWRLDEGTGQTIHDLSGSGNDGLLGGSVAADASDPTWISSTAPVE